MSTRIQIRRDLVANWTSVNPVLFNGELGFATDLGKFKIGDGSTTWNSLAYAAVLPSEITELAQDALSNSLTGGSGISVSYNDAANTLTVENTGTLSFNTRTGAVTLTSNDVNDALGYTAVSPTTLSNSSAASISAAAQYTDSQIMTEVTNRNDAIGTAKSEAISSSNSTTSTKIGDNTVDGTLGNTLTNRISTAKSEAISSANGYTDSAITSLGNSAAESYVLLSDVGNLDGVASLDSTGNVPIAQLGNLIDGAPALLDTLNEIAAAINDDASIADTLTTAIGTKQDKVTGVSDTEISYLEGVTSKIQDQLNSKAASADIAELAQDAVGSILGTGLSYNDNGPGIGIDNAGLGNYLLEGASGSSYGLIGTSAYLDVKNTNGYNKEIELDIEAVETKLNTDGYLTTSSTSTLTNKTLTSPKINEDVALTATATELNTLDGIIASTTELNYTDGVTSGIQDQLDDKAPLDSPTFTTKVNIDTNNLNVGSGSEALRTTDSYTNPIAVFSIDADTDYAQLAVKNTGSGPNSSTDIIAYANNGDDTSGYIDMGITSPTFSDPNFTVTGQNDGYIFMEAPAGTSGTGNLVLATGGNGTDNKIVFAAGGLQSNNTQMQIIPEQNVHIGIATQSISASTGALTVDGGVGIIGNLSVNGNARLTDTIYVGENAETFNSTATLTNPGAVISLSGGPYAQLAVHNETSTASSDIIAYADNGNDTSGWIDMGITGSTFEQAEFGITGANDGYLFYEAPDGTSGQGNLVIATGANGTQNKIIFGAGGYDSGNTQMEIIPDESVHIDIPTPSTSPTTGALTVAGGVGILGDMNIQGDVSIEGTITFGGAGTTVETSNLSVTDPLVFVGANNTSDIIDLGLVGEYNVTGTTKYAGVVRDASDGVIKFFKDTTVKPTNTVDFAQASLSDIKVAALDATSITVGNVSNTEIGYLDGVTSGIQSQLNTKASLTGNETLSNKTLAYPSITVDVVGLPITLTSAELAHVSGVSSSIQEQLNTKSPSANPTFTGTVNLPSTTSIGNVSSTEVSYLDGVTSAIQTQLDDKQPKVSGVSDTEIGYLDGVTSGIQSQIDAKLASSTAASTYAPISSPTFTGTVAGITKTMVGLGNVDNTSDADKPVSNATQSALDAKASLSGATFTGAVSGTSLTLSGDLTVNGTTTTVNTTNFTTSDPVIYLGEGNNANSVDLGFVASFNDGTYQHTGLVKDTSDSKWKLFKGVTDEPTATVNFAQGSLDTLAVGALEASSATIGNVSNTELQYLDGVTSAIQTQIDAKAPLASPTFTGSLDLTGSAASSLSVAYGSFTGSLDIDNTGIYLSTSSTVPGDDSATIAAEAGILSLGTNFGDMYYDNLGLQVSMNGSDSVNRLTVLGNVLNPLVVNGNTTTISGTAVLPSTTSIGNVSSTELGYLDGVTSAIQTQLNAKLATSTASSTYAPIDSPTFTGTVSGISKAMVGLGLVENTTLSTWGGSSNITTLGTIGTGTWNATAISTTKGGTGLTSYTTGDVIYASGTNTLSKLSAGTSGQILTVNAASGLPAWENAPITLPSQTGNTGKYLTTDGSSASWATLTEPINAFMLMGA